MKSFLLLFFGTTLLFATMTQAVKQNPENLVLKRSFHDAPECEGRPEFITEVRPDIIGSVEKLPQMVLVARDAEYYVESKDSQSDLKIHSYQSFTSKDPQDQARIVCANAKNLDNNRFSLFAPTLIDTTATQKTGQSLWQFQVLADKSGFSTWNKKSLAFSQTNNLEKTLEHLGTNYRIYQLTHDEYEIVISKKENGVTQYLSVRYDAVPSI